MNDTPCIEPFKLSQHMSLPRFCPFSNLPGTLLLCTLSVAASASPLDGDDEDDPIPALDGPALKRRLTQEEVASGRLSLRELRREGLRIFSTSFNKYDGFGDGPMDALDPTSPGGRPTIGDNGTFLRINGLDAQSCAECHGILSNRSVPPTFAIGGVGGGAAAAMPGPTTIDVADEAGNGFAFFNGRMVNPPFLWGAGGVELAAKEMTADLQALKEQARSQPGVPVALETKGVSFGSITYDDNTNTFETSRVEGVDHDLVVRPFGRKGEFSSIRAFDVAAYQFHQGIQPVEVFGRDVDADGDGVVNELLEGELSAVHAFSVMNRRPRQVRMEDRDRRDRGLELFHGVGCAECHVPRLKTRSERLGLAFPEVEEDPTANVYMRVKLRGKPAGFDRADGGGIRVPMFSDLKRHDMGHQLAEATGSELDPYFLTARLWGVADTAPYMHDGRALTLREAIEMHGGESAEAAGSFLLLSDRQQSDVLYFLYSLRVPDRPNRDL